MIAHRGASFDQPENTLPAFERAIAMGADYVELDVWHSLEVTHDRPRRGVVYPSLGEVVRPLPRPDRADGRAEAAAR